MERMLGQLVAHGTAEEKRHINYPVQGEIMMQGACGLRVFCWRGGARLVDNMA
jgi:hypothetical protein